MKRVGKRGWRFRFGTVFAAIAFFAYHEPPSLQAAQTSTPKLNVQDSAISRDTKVTTSFAPVVKKVTGSVVYIYTTTTLKETPARNNPFLGDPFFRRFFGYDNEDSPSRRPRQRK